MTMTGLLLDVATSPVPSNRDYITTGGLVICTLTTVIGGVLVALIQSNRKLTKRGMQAAQTAADRTEATGNGFSEHVTEALKRIEDTQAEQARDIGGIRQEIRAERVERITLARAVSNFIERNDQ